MEYKPICILPPPYFVIFAPLAPVVSHTGPSQTAMSFHHVEMTNQSVASWNKQNLLTIWKLVEPAKKATKVDKSNNLHKLTILSKVLSKRFPRNSVYRSRHSRVLNQKDLHLLSMFLHVSAHLFFSLSLSNKNQQTTTPTPTPTAFLRQP